MIGILDGNIGASNSDDGLSVASKGVVSGIIE